jgi:hypothetical protein
VNEHRKAVLHRLYLTAFWPLLVLAMVVPAYHAVVYAHDRIVVAHDFKCAQQEGEWSPTAWLRCNIRLSVKLDVDSLGSVERDPYSFSIMERDVDSLEKQGWEVRRAADGTLLAKGPDGKIHEVTGRYYSARAWQRELAEMAPIEWFVRDRISSSVLATLPVVLLVLGRRWLRWLLKPPKTGGPTSP